MRTNRRHKLVVVMVGLPARGKSYVAQKLERYLNWNGLLTRIFNVGEYRRAQFGALASADFFSPENVDARNKRLEVAKRALDDLFDWVREEGEIAIYDATNTTRARRELIMERCNAESVNLMFIEALCEDPAVDEATIRETKAGSRDYECFSPEDAIKDFLARIEHYRRAYEPVDHQDCSYVKLTDLSRHVVLNRIEGELGVRITHFLMSLHSVPQPV